jgi:hypothetical protein
MNNFLTSKAFRPFSTFYIHPCYFPSLPEPIHHQPKAYTQNNIQQKPTIKHSTKKQPPIQTTGAPKSIDCRATYAIIDTCNWYKRTPTIY